MAPKTQIATKQQPVTVAQVMERAKLFWAGLRPQQQLFLGLGLALTLAVVAFLVHMIATPEYKPLMKGLEPADAQAITAQLAAKKIEYQVSPDGTSISVPADQLDAARMEVASHDAPHSGRIGFEIFDKVSWGQTEFDEKVNYQRALEGELERTIQTISNVKSARVHLVMAAESVFIDRERGAKASVTLKLRRGELSRDELSAISRLVAGAVDDLKPTDVVIVDADSNRTLGQGNSNGEGTDSLERELTQRLMTTLAPVVGADHLRATVNVEYETGSSEESQEKYDPTVSAALTTQHSEEGSGSGSVVGGVPGTSSNVPKPKDGAAKNIARDPGQYSRTDNNTYGVNKITRHVIEPSGGIRRITAAVLLDDAIERRWESGKWVEFRHKRQPEELKPIEELAQAAIGFNTDRGDVISVQNLTFDHAAPVDPLPLTPVEQVRKAMADYSLAIRYATLLLLFLLVYLLTIRPIQKRVLATRPVPVPVKSSLQTEPELAAPDPQTLLAQRSMALKKQLAEFVKAEPESSTTAVRAWLREEAPQ
jgi:flagellar M-ring protein FliF